MGSLMPVVNMGDNIKDGKHKPVKRKHTFCNFHPAQWALSLPSNLQIPAWHREAQVEGH